MNEDKYRLLAFLSCLVTILLLSKIGGTGADLAIMTGVIALAGALLNTNSSKKVEIDNKPNNPVPTTNEDEQNRA
jgi:predicted RNA methylase